MKARRIEKILWFMVWAAILIRGAPGWTSWENHSHVGDVLIFFCIYVGVIHWDLSWWWGGVCQ
jgi:hypothetical protein